ncbi:hypothetical protein AVEN_86995-1 [Araneus ventricosus]|uniref:Uncharacterized protein n=1 Tax=Araneus ventricosus TaxID=182803 RepID=A0A4Y2QG80_ARAVE|nr:hypothetical protein AVEN_86995-1 [Araneus ventricosus]
MPVIKQRDINEDCAKTLSCTENKLAEDTNTSFIEEKSVKDRSPPKQGVKHVNGDLLVNLEFMVPACFSPILLGTMSCAVAKYCFGCAVRFLLLSCACVT